MPNDEDITVGDLFDKEELNLIDDSRVMCGSCFWVGIISETMCLEQTLDEDGEIEVIRLGCPRCKSDVDLMEQTKKPD